MSTRTTVLLVDDDEALLWSLGEAVSNCGYKYLVASDGQTALDIIERSPDIDVIVSDISMPRMDGIEFIRIVRDKFKDRFWLQVLFMTGYATVDKSIEALRIQALDFLNKPVRRKELLVAINIAAGKALQQRCSGRGWSEKQRQVVDLLEGAIDLGRKLSTGQQKASTASVKAHPEVVIRKSTLPVWKPDKKRMLELLKMRDIRARYFSEKIFLDSAWLMLVDLMENHLLEKQVSLSSIYLAAGVSAATASRRLEELEAAGLVERMLDPVDRRRQIIVLTSKSTELMEAYLTALHNQTKMASEF